MSAVKTAITPTTHVIFDFGGTLLDIPSFNAIFKDIARSHGKELIEDQEEGRETESMTEAYADFLEWLGEPNDSESVDKFKLKVREEVERKGLRLMSGVNRLVQHLKRKDIPMAIATNCYQKGFDVFLNGLIDFDPSCLSHVVCGEGNPEVLHNKPAPDVYLVCVKKFAISPKSLDSCVIFEDSLLGITGAVSTGMKTVLVNGRRGPKFADIEPKVTQIVNNYDEFRPESVGLPPYDD